MIIILILLSLATVAIGYRYYALLKRYNKEIQGYKNKETLIIEYRDSLDKASVANENARVAFENLDAAREKVLVANQRIILELAKLVIHHRVIVFSLMNPNQKVSQEYIYKIQDIHDELVSNKIDGGEYLQRVTEVLDEIHPIFKNTD